MITLRVDGEPAPQGSKSVGRHGGVYEKSKKVKPWRAAIVAAALRKCAPATGPIYGTQPLKVQLVFILARPRGHYGTGRNAEFVRAGAPVRPAARPDLDKLIRSTLDGLKLAGVYGDDGQVTSLIASKRYVHDGEMAGAEIGIWEEL